jgi:GTP-binding protein
MTRDYKPWEIYEASFLLSATQRKHYPTPPLPQVAFAGRSNVGKSSLLNCLVRQRRLAKTSQTPGLTQLINFFLINSQWHFVDLPGYGYAKAPPSAQFVWKKMIEEYLQANPDLRLLVLLLDARREPSELDDQLVEYLQYQNIPMQFVLTKTDKLTHSALLKAQHGIAEHYDFDLDEVPLATSAETGRGREELLKIIWEELSGSEVRD